MSIKIDIISGFLGAGKTTMIKKLLDEGVLGTQVAIIENEFGDINIDFDRLNNPKSDVKIRSISSGCICCTLAGEFGLAIRDLIEKFGPKRIIIEPTGVGRLSDILLIIDQVKKYEDIKQNIVMTVVDTDEFEDFIKMFGDFFTDQIKRATTIALSKIQLTNELKVNRVIDSIREINPVGNIIATPWDRLDASYILEIAELSGKAAMNDKNNKLDTCCNSYGHYSYKNNAGKKQLEFCSFETMKRYDKIKLGGILNTLNDKIYGEIFRAKGTLLDNYGEWMDFDYTSKKTDISKGNTSIIGKAIIIGKKLDKETIKELFR